MELAENIFAVDSSLTFGAVNAEVNAAICTVTRMLTEANDINDWVMYVYSQQQLRQRISSIMMYCPITLCDHYCKLLWAAPGPTFRQLLMSRVRVSSSEQLRFAPSDLVTLMLLIKASRSSCPI